MHSIQDITKKACFGAVNILFGVHEIRIEILWK